MSVRGLFGYDSVIPTSGDGFSLIINLRVPQTGGIQRVATIYQSSNQYISFDSNGTNLSLHFYRGSTDLSIPLTLTKSLNYIIFDYNNLTTTTRLWHPETFVASSISQDSRITPSTLYFHGNASGSFLNAAPAIATPPDIFYWMLLNRVLTTEDVGAICSGILPLENFSLTPNILIFRDYPHQSTSDYINSIGTAAFNGTSSTSSSNLSTKQYGTYSSINNQDRGTRIVISHSLSFSQREMGIKNDEYVIGTVIQFEQAAQYPITRTYNITDTFSFNENYDLVDKYLTFDHNMTFNQLLTTSFEYVKEITTNVKFKQLIKTWDGKISSELTFTTALISSIKIYTIVDTFTLELTEIEHNWKYQKWTDTLFLDEEMLPSDYEELEVDENVDGIVIVEEITCGKDLTRPVSNSLTFFTECDAYKVTLQDTVDYGE